MSKRRVLIIDDHKIVRDGLKAILLAHPSYVFAGEAATSSEGLELLKTLQPDLALIDYKLPDLSGDQLAQKISTAHPTVKLIMLTGESQAPGLKQAMQYGVKGLLSKEATKDEYYRAFDEVSEGRFYVSPQFSNLLLTPDADTRLTARELEVLKALAEGLSYNEAGEKLNISPRTVETHKERIFQKLSLKNMAELIKYAIREGLVQL